eukprot:7815399-Ditylum_brightwellii.AAC.1
MQVSWYNGKYILPTTKLPPLTEQHSSSILEFQTGSLRTDRLRRYPLIQVYCPGRVYNTVR